MREENFSPVVLGLGVATAAVGECVLRVGAQASARATVLWGFWQALALVLLCVLAAVVLAGRGVGTRFASGILAIWFAWELIQTLWQAQVLCREQFDSSAVIGLAPFFVWLGWKCTTGQINRTARPLWCFALCGVLVCAVGLGAQMQWQCLLENEAAALPPVEIYAEYFAFPLLCPRQGRILRRAAWLPMIGFLVQSGFCMGMELLFGSQYSGYAGAELLRALSIGAFSRLDAFLLLIWLVLALYRVCVLCAAIKCLLQKAAANQHTEDGLC